MIRPRQVVVNEHDEVIGAKSREEIGRDEIYRVSAVWVVVPRGGRYKVLIAQRKLTKKHDPGKWGPSVAGTVDEGETYESNAVKELGEEVGLAGVEPVPIDGRSKFHDEFGDGGYRYFFKRFIAKGDWQESDFTKQESEVENLKIVDIDELICDIKQRPGKFLPGFVDSVLELKQFLQE
ncbi:MAG: NUDIX domain-containing protein [Candidatus Nomurabacteria bacterium]|nr:NUDIX domain-containing protein [Candidatus Nomurabacteria bacterium]